MPLAQAPRAVARIAPLALPPHSLHERCRPAIKFRVILRSPRGLLAFQKTQQLAALNFLASRLQQKSAAPARPHQIIDFLQQIAGDQDVCSLCACHMCLISVP